MPRTMTATTVAELAEISDFLHDAWIDAESLVYDEEASMVTVPFRVQRVTPRADGSERRLFERTHLETRTYLLRIRGASSLDFEDKEQVGHYDLTDLTFDAGKNRLLFRTGVPLHLAIQVRRLDLELSSQDDPVAEAEGLRLKFDLVSRPPRPRRSDS